MKKIRIMTCVGVVCVLCLVIAAFMCLGSKTDIGLCTEYECDVKNFRLNTTIEITKDGEEFAKVTGDILKFVTDPLTMKDPSGNKLAYAGDVYHFIAQDSHSVFVNDEVSVEMVGKVKFFGEAYDIYNAKGEMIAKVEFNDFNTDGEMYDMNGNLIADFNSKWLFSDFTVRITENCNLDEKTVLMIICSYYSDYSADSQN